MRAMVVEVAPEIEQLGFQICRVSGELILWRETIRSAKRAASRV
jgi:hypothetical protein